MGQLLATLLLVTLSAIGAVAQPLEGRLKIVHDTATLRIAAGIARRLRRLELLEELRRAPNRVVLYNLLIGRPGQYRSQ